MTGVLDPTTAAAPRKSLAGDPNIGSGVPNNVRLLDSRRVDVAPLTANADAARPPVLEVAKDALCPAADRERIGVRFLSRIRAWMVVPVVDFALMVAPLAWRPPQFHSIVTMAVLATFLLTGGGRYVARLHLSVLDELPTILTRMLTAAAAVASVILYHAPKGGGINLPRNGLPGHRRWLLLAASSPHVSLPSARRSGIAQVSHRPDWGRSAGH